MKLAYLRWVVPAIICITLSGPAFAAASLPTSGNARTPAAATSTAAAPTPVRASSGDVASYAQREQASQQLEQFRGGASIYIGGSALVIVLLIVLLVLLL